MKKVYLLMILALIIQEPASTDAAIFQIRHLHLSLVLWNAIWLAGSMFDIWIGYVFGKWIQKRFEGTKFEKVSKNWATKIETFIGKKGERFALVLIGIISSPYINSFFASWLNISFRKIFTLILIGDIIYWAIEWIINLSARSFFTNPYTALYVIIGIALIFSIISKAVFNRVLKKY